MAAHLDDPLMATRGLSPEQAEELVAALSEAKDDEAQQAAAETLQRACFYPANDPSLLDAGAAPALATAMREWEDAKAKESCARAIGHLALKSMGTLALVDAGVLEPLVAFISHLDDYNKTSPAVVALFHLTQDTPFVIQKLLGVQGVMEALEAMKDGEGDGGLAKSLFERLNAFTRRRVKAART